MTEKPEITYPLKRRTRLTTIHIALGRGAEITASVQAEWDLFSFIGNLDTSTSNALLATQLLQRVSSFQPYVSRADLLAAVSHARQVRMDSAAFADEPAISQLQAWRGLAQTYRMLDCSDEELSAAQEAEDICRGLAETDPQRYAADLADVLAFRAAHAGEDPETSIDFVKEVVSIRREIFSREPDRANSDELVRALLALGQELSSAGYHGGAIQVTEEAVNVRQHLAEKFGGNEYLNLAGALYALMTRLAKGRMSHGAATAAMERVAIYRRLAAVDFSRYGRDLLMALTDSMDAYVAGGMKARLGDTAREVIKLCRRIWERADRLNLDISKVLAGAGLALARTGMFDDAVILLSDAVSVRRERVAMGAFGEYAPELIRALGYLADTLMIMEHWRKALKPADEAFAICGRLLVEAPRDRPHKRRRSDTEQFYACLVRLYDILQGLGRYYDAARIRRQGLEALELLATQGNLTAMNLLHRDFPRHSPQNGIRSPSRAI